MNRRNFLASLAATTGVAASGVQAQPSFPTQPIRWVVPYPAGGGTDLLARTIAEAMRPALGQQLQVDNRPGAATNTGAQIVASARPDGYSLLSADNAVLAFNEHLFSKLPFNPEKDFTYIGGISRFPLALVVHPSFEARTLKDFIAYAKANPGKLSYTSPGNGSPHHLAMELFKQRTGTDIAHAPNQGAALAMQDVAKGQVPCMFLDLPTGLSTMQSGKVRVLSVGTAKRVPQLPGAPTLAESGVANAEVFAFQGLLGPARLPPVVTGRLSLELNLALADPAVARRMTELGMEPLPGTPERFHALARAEAKRWGEIIRTTGLKLA